MARLTIEELKKDPLTKGDFERMKIMGLDPNFVRYWIFVTMVTLI